MEHFLANLSSTQQSIWIKQSLYPESSIFNVGGYTVLSGSNFNAQLALKAFDILLENTDSIHLIGNLINDNSEGNKLFNCHFVDFSEKDKSEEYSINWMHADMKEKIDFPNCLLKIYFIKSTDNIYYLYVKAHHLVMDGVSFMLINSKASEIYNYLLAQEEVIVNEENFKFEDFIIEQKEFRNSQDYNNQKEFWLNTFLKAKKNNAFESIIQCSTVESFNSERKYFPLKREVFSQIERFCVDNKCSVFHYFIGVIFLLNKLYGNDDFSLGLPIFNRNNRKQKQTTGTFISVLPFYFELIDEDSFIETIIKIKYELIKYYKNQRFPLIDLHDDLKLGSSYFNAMFSYQKIQHKNELFTISSPENVHLHPGVQEEDISFHLTEYRDESDLKIEIDYKTNLFTEQTIETLSKHFVYLTEQLFQSPEKPISEISCLSEQEENLLRHRFNDTFKELPNAKTFIDLFEEQVLVHPDNTALVFKTISYTYSELNSISNQFAHYLLSHYSVKPDDLVGIQLERSEWVLISILAIYKAGAAYIPIDPEYPAERIEFIQKNAKCKLVLDQNEVIAFQKSQASYPLDNPAKVNSGTDLAYVIYTSGSTGQPKGSMIEHAGMLNHLLAMADELQLNENSKIAQIAGYTFDISVWQLLNSLIVGGATVIYDYETILEPTTFIDQLNKDQISILQVVPSYLKSLLEVAEAEQRADFSNLNYLLVTGEAVNQPLLKWWFRIFPNIRVVNAYGPAEASDDVTLHIMNQAPEGSNVPVGKPIQNSKIYILNAMQQLCPIGVEGEICVSGIGVGRGYLNDPERTKMSFVSDPFEENAVRMYRTGDIGRWRSDGTIEFTGRKDDQVKIRGYRIELAEIESSLLQYPPISEAVIVAREDQNKEKNLVAYFVSESTLNREEIREYLVSRLPLYMVPTFFVQLENMPLNANGKVDKKALPIPDETEIYRSEIYVEARNETEAKVAEIWKEVLQIETIGMKDDFFELGGHSLKMIKVLSKIKDVLDVKIEMALFFNNPTIDYIAKYIDAVQYIGISEENSNEELIF